MDEVFKNLEKKNNFNSNIFTKNDQLYFMDMIDKIEIYKGNLKDSDISFISKS